ncbi:MAG TPA: replicative DNA helicase [Planctomycetaceae bacterium]|nr:replicative DNA helicase [Planctomycetaceae bacterium]
MKADNSGRKSYKKRGDAGAPLDTALIDRVPPHDLEAERGVIGAMLLDPLVCDDVVILVSAGDFYSDANRRIFRQMIEMRNDGIGIDLLLLRARLEQTEELEAVGGEGYLAELVLNVHVTAHAAHYANIVRDKATLRQLIHTSAGILRDSYEPEAQTKELLNRAAQDIFEVCEARTTNQVFDIKTVMLETFTQIDARLEGHTDGIATGFTELDSMTGGMHPSELIILAARPSMGKTALALNITDHVAVVQKMPTLFVSLEMQRIELAQRLLCSRGRIDSNKFRGQFMSKEDRGRLVEASNVLGESPLFIDDSPGRSIAEIAAVGRRLKRQYDLRFLVVDYLGLIEPDNMLDSRQEQVAKMARRLKGLARELHVPILCLAQLNRQAEQGKEREGHRPKLSHLRESGAIEQDADVVLFVHREERYVSREEAEEKGLLGKAELMVAKQRQGAIGDIDLLWRGEHTLFLNPQERSLEEFTEFTSHASYSSDVGYDANDADDFD